VSGASRRAQRRIPTPSTAPGCFREFAPQPRLRLSGRTAGVQETPSAVEERRFSLSGRAPLQPEWKSGASAPRKAPSPESGFSPRRVPYSSRVLGARSGDFDFKGSAPYAPQTSLRPNPKPTPSPLALSCPPTPPSCPLHSPAPTCTKDAQGGGPAANAAGPFFDWRH
jgi:hypothetical protein